MKVIEFFIILVMLVVVAACVLPKKPQAKNPLKTVRNVDLNRYVGKWHEIARFDHRFQKGCAASVATYTFRDDGKLDVLNECTDASSGKRRQARGKAWVVDSETNAKLKVSFFWPFSGDYWIIDLGENYEYSVVGHPDRKYLWVLSRSAEMPTAVYQGILTRLQDQGYDTEGLQLNIQPTGSEANHDL